MGKLLRRANNKSPDAEQLLTPRKQGFFGKRNSGVRSEDYDKPKSSSKSARRLVTSVFKGSSKREDDENNQFDAFPTPTKNVGTPKTAPPSPDLVGTVLARDTGNHNSRQYHNNNVHTPMHHSQHGVDGSETVMSDLTGTISPQPHHSNNITLAEEKASGITPPAGAQGVTFAENSGSFYSAYSPSLGVFRTESGHVVNVGCDIPNGSYHTPPPDAQRGEDGAGGFNCKPTMLDQVLGVVEGACGRKLDVTLGMGKLSQSATLASARSAPEWGMAPSEDDESTYVDTRADTSYRDGESTFVTRTCATTPSATICTGSMYTGVNSVNGDTTVFNDETVATNTVATPHSAPPPHLDANSLAMMKPLADASLESKQSGSQSLKSGSLAAGVLPIVRERSDELQHENFELVLGPDFNSNSKEKAVVSVEAAPKKKGLSVPKILKTEKVQEEKKEDIEEASSSIASSSVKAKATSVSTLTKTVSTAAAAAVAVTKVAESTAKPQKVDTPSAASTKTPQRATAPPAASTPPTPSPTRQVSPTAPAQFSPSAIAAEASNSLSAPNSPIPSKEEQREALYQSVFGDDFTSEDVGVEIHSKKFAPQPNNEKPATSSKPSKKGLSGLVKRLRFGKLRRTKSTSSVTPTNTKSFTAGTPPNANKRAAPPASPTKPPLSPTRKAKSSSAIASYPNPTATKAAAPVTSATKTALAVAAATSAARAAKPKEKEEEKKELEETLDITFVTDNTSNGPSLKDNKDSPEADSSDAIPAVKKVHSDIKGVAAEPNPLNMRSNSFQLPDSNNKSRPNSPSPEEGEAKGDLEKTSPLERLRSAPDKMSSSERGVKAPRRPPKLTWKAAQDSQGRMYYYHRETRKTQWTKPDEFDAELLAVKKYKEEMEAAKKEASERETQEVVDAYKSVEAIQAQLRKKTQRDFDPKVWQTKQEILDIVKSMPLPKGTNIEKLLIQYDGREEQLLANLRDLVESKPFDEPFQAPRHIPARQLSNASSRSEKQVQAPEAAVNLSHTSSSVSSTALHAGVEVQQRVRTAVSASTRVSERTYLTEKTEKIRNTSKGPSQDQINTIRENGDAMSTGSISSASRRSIPAGEEEVALNANARIPSKIPAVPRSRDLKVEEFSNDRLAKETYNGDGVIPPTPTRKSIDPEPAIDESAELPIEQSRPADAGHSSAKAVAQHIVALSSLDDDDDSYNGDHEGTVTNDGHDTESEKMPTDSISALSEADVDYVAQKENFERARRRALDVAVEREDWDLAAALSEGMKQVKESLYGKPAPQREWTQTELDRFISENDWDAVSKYIAHMRDNSLTERSPSIDSGSRMHNLSHISSPSLRGVRDPETGRDPEGYAPATRMHAPAPMDEVPPPYVSEASKRAASHTLSGRRQLKELTTPHSMLNTSISGSHSSSHGSGKRAQTHFGARSQLQHSDLTSMSSWGESSSSYDSEEYTDNSYESDDEQGYISLRVHRRSEFEC